MCENVVRVQNVCLFLFQVSDVEKILGIVHTETIQVSAEAYDIALDISPGKKSVALHKLYMNITGFISNFFLLLKLSRLFHFEFCEF